MFTLHTKIDACSSAELPEKVGIDESLICVPEGKRFDNQTEAQTYCDGLENPLPYVAVSILEPKISTETQKAIDKLRARANEMAEKVLSLAVIDPGTGQETWRKALEDEIVLRNQQVKVATRSCVACGSKIATAFIKSFCCPVCGSDAFLTTTGDQDRFRSKAERIQAAKDEQQAASTKADELERTSIASSDEFKRVWLIFHDASRVAGAPDSVTSESLSEA